MSEQEKFVPPEALEIISQVEPTEAVADLVSEVERPLSADSLAKIRDLIYAKIERRPVDESSAGPEKELRWKRTAGQILDDGYTYAGKDCTDLAVLFMAACQALGHETRFVKLKKENKIHSVVEILLDDGWYAFDPSNRESVPAKGEISETQPWKDWQFWKKGRDAWDLGLTDFDSKSKIK